MSQFKFKLLTGADPDAQYTDVAVKDAYTFYLLKNGKGYLGELPLFGDAAIGVDEVEIIAFPLP